MQLVLIFSSFTVQCSEALVYCTVDHYDYENDIFIVIVIIIIIIIRKIQRRINNCFMPLLQVVNEQKLFPLFFQLYKKAIKMWNEYEDAYVNLGDLLVQMGMLDKAEQVFAKLLEFSPRSENGLYNVSICSFQFLSLTEIVITSTSYVLSADL